eukprot:1153303-Pelagomonas_calceolata.AAC.9
MSRCPEIMGKALTMHNNIIRKARWWVNAGGLCQSSTICCSVKCSAWFVALCESEEGTLVACCGGFMPLSARFVAL